VTFDRTEQKMEHCLQLGRLLHTDWFSGPLLVLQVVTAPAPQPAAVVSTHTEQVTERVSLRGPAVPLTTRGTFVRSVGAEGMGAGE
jgi:hypothetical protein